MIPLLPQSSQTLSEQFPSLVEVTDFFSYDDKCEFRIMREQFALELGKAAN
jgi:hypothetical protein